MDLDLSLFKDSFFTEIAEHILQIEAGLLELQAGRAESERLHAIFRAAHSVKGSAATFGWTAIVRLTHAMEDLLDRLRGGRLEPTTRVIRALLSAVDEVKAIMARKHSGNDFAASLSPLARAILAELNQLLTNATKPPSAAIAVQTPVNRATDREYLISFFPSLRCFQKGINPLLALRQFADFGMIVSCELDASLLPALVDLDPMVCHVGWTLKLRTMLDEADVRTAFSLIDGDAEIAGLGSTAKTPVDGIPGVVANSLTPLLPAARESREEPAQSIRVPARKVDELIDLSGELVIANSIANQILVDFTLESLPRLREAMAAIERGTRDLQERVMSVRMLPAATVFQRFPRLVYDIAGRTGKRISLQITGESTELDKTVAEQLLDPLTHLIRNSADHGIETPEARQRAGKPEQGRISLRACHQSGKVVIEVADDGQGLESEKIRQKAIAKGLIGADAKPTEAELHQLIFVPGFSTKDQATDLSGRGVGMDVVKRNVEALNGSIRIESVAGQGTVVRLHLPLTLAIVDGLLLRVAEQSFALPFSAVVESIRPKASQLIRLGNSPSGRQGLVLRSESLPLLALSTLFGIAGAVTDPTHGMVVIVDTGARRIALLADDIVGHQQFVIKSVEKNFRRVEGALGATILGDGKVALIIDASALWEMTGAPGGSLVAA